MRKQIVAGNWKMNKNASETKALLQDLIAQADKNTKAEIIVAPTFVNLGLALDALKGTNIHVAAQNLHQKESGAYTGEISASMLTDIGIDTVILGHSERRAYFFESDAILAEKVNTALKNKLRIIFCFGEELKERKENTHFALVESQLKNGLFHLTAQDWKNIVLAYEPVWAIGTGETASPEQAQEMHAFIRQIIAAQYGNDLAEEVTILYGGSVKPDNAKEIFGKKDVDGGLIGGASLNATDFLAIANGF
jgi:triosephosphate isomerase (TIM)